MKKVTVEKALKLVAEYGHASIAHFSACNRINPRLREETQERRELQSAKRLLKALVPEHEWTDEEVRLALW